MFEHINREEVLFIIKEIEADPQSTQRTISEKLGISLGKINYLFQELVKKGLIKARYFSKDPEKLRKIHYVLTREGLEHKMRLTYHFLKKKEVEYNNIKKEWEMLTTYASVASGKGK